MSKLDEELTDLFNEMGEEEAKEHKHHHHHDDEGLSPEEVLGLPEDGEGK